MRGAVAAGHTLTAEAGAEVLREGGNAVDACIAAACMSWVTESTLTSPGGGGFLLVRESSTGRVRLHDFFIAIPGQGLARPPGEMEAVDVEFDRGTSQIFRIGGASVGVPGAIAGLEAAHRAYATLPWRRLLEPAIAVAREGHELTKPQAFLHAILDVILRRTETGREIFGPEGVRLVEGDRLVMPELATTLELLADKGAGAFYGGELGRRVSDYVRGAGGSLTEADRGGLAGRLFAGIDGAAARIEAREPGRPEPAGAPGTTHISAVDAAGNAASMTASNGSGAGVIVPGTGIHLNNMLGEYDLNPLGRRNQSGAIGRRLTSMMAPSLVLDDGRPRLVVGSAGSVRLRGAILQIVLNATLHGMDVGKAIAQPRVHLEEPHLHCEGGADPAELDRLAQWGYELVRWRRRNLYFGGAAAVELLEDGSLDAAGDPRRGGHGVVV